MPYSENNRFLAKACRALRAARPLAPSTVDFTLRSETIGNAAFVSLWFRTRGCRHDAAGGCTMCEYGASTTVTAEHLINEVKHGLAALPWSERMTLLLSPSGSMFDDWEVPPDARSRIFELVRRNPTAAVMCESRAEFIVPDTAAEFAQVFGDRRTGIGTGLESADEFVLKYCVNKRLTRAAYLSAIETTNAVGSDSISNVLLGAPFLTPAEALDDAVRSVIWAQDQGSTHAILFPAHVRPFTLAHWLWRHDSYRPPSLWSLAEVLHRLGPERATRVTISWYKDYFASEDHVVGDGTPSVAASPTTCPTCLPAVIALLDEYRNTGSFQVIETISGIECDCKREWRESLRPQNEPALCERIACAYEAIGRDVLGDDYWDANGDGIVSELHSDAECR